MMGKVFTWEEIKEGKVPSIERFYLVRDKLLYPQLRDFLSEELILGAMVFGSVVTGDVNERSDVDVLIVASNHLEKLGPRLRELKDKAKKIHVPLDLIVIPSELAKSSMHSVTLALLDYLEILNKKRRVKIIGKNPINLLSQGMRISDYLDDVRNRFRFSINRLLKTFLGIEAEMERPSKYCYCLRRALEAPFHTARRMLILTGKREVIMKAEILKGYRESFDNKLGDLLFQVSQIDSAYTNFISKEKSNQKLSLNLYQKVLKELEKTIPLALEFERQNALLVEKNFFKGN
jgi:predicted nucleotidyltransferase